MSRQSRDLTIEDVLADPVIGAAMRADHVDPRGFEGLLRATACRLEASRERVAGHHLSRICASLAGRAAPVPCRTRPTW